MKIVYPLPSLAPKIPCYYLLPALSLLIEQPTEVDSGRFSRALGNGGATGWKETQFLYTVWRIAASRAPTIKHQYVISVRKNLFCKTTEILGVLLQ